MKTVFVLGAGASKEVAAKYAHPLSDAIARELLAGYQLPVPVIDMAIYRRGFS